MNIKALAKQAGFIVDNDSEKYQPQCIQATHSLIDEPLKKFALLVAEHEREECANLCMAVPHTGAYFAKLIRARSKHETR